MKKQIIDALRKTIPTTPTDRRKLDEILLELKKSGPSIDAVELARLVMDVRLPQEKEDASKDGQIVKETRADHIVKKIGIALDLVEMCHFMLIARRAQRGEYISKMFEIETPKKLTDIKSGIYSERYPLDFATGLTRIGVTGDSIAKRVEKFRECFNTIYSPNMQERELLEAFERRRNTPWQTDDELWHWAEQWAVWSRQSKSKAKSAAGVASVKARGATPKGRK